MVYAGFGLRRRNTRIGRPVTRPTSLSLADQSAAIDETLQAVLQRALRNPLGEKAREIGGPDAGMGAHGILDFVQFVSEHWSGHASCHLKIAPIAIRAIYCYTRNNQALS